MSRLSGKWGLDIQIGETIHDIFEFSSNLSLNISAYWRLNTTDLKMSRERWFLCSWESGWAINRLARGVWRSIKLCFVEGHIYKWRLSRMNLAQITTILRNPHSFMQSFILASTFLKVESFYLILWSFFKLSVSYSLCCIVCNTGGSTSHPSTKTLDGRLMDTYLLLTLPSDRILDGLDF